MFNSAEFVRSVKYVGHSEILQTSFPSDSAPAYIAIAINDVLSIYQEGSNELFWEVSIDNRISTVSISEDSMMLLVTDNTATVYLFHIPSKILIWKHVVQNKATYPSVLEVQHSFLKESSGELKIFLYMKQKVLFTIYNIIIKDLFLAVEKNCYENFFKGIKIDQTDLSKLYPDHVFKPLQGFPCDLLCAVEETTKSCHTLNQSMDAINDTDLSVDESRFGPNFTLPDEYFLLSPDNVTFLDSPFKDNPNEKNSTKSTCFRFQGLNNIKKMIKTKDGKFLVHLSKMGSLSILDASDFTVLNTWHCPNTEETIEDFVINETFDHQNSAITACRFGLLLKCKNAQQSQAYKFEIRDFSFKHVYSANLSTFAQMVTSKTNQEYWCIINGDLLQVGSNNVLKDISITTLSEVLPEKRFKNLIAQKKYAEALQYASDYNLNSEFIYQERVKHALEALTSADSADCDLLAQVEKDLLLIKNEEFVESCLSHVFRAKAHMKILLRYFKDWVTAHNTDEDSTLVKINESIFRLETFETLSFALETSLTPNEFIEKDLLDYVVELIKGKDFKAASIVWQRHQEDVLKSHNKEIVEEILQVIQEDIDSQYLNTLLLEDLLPFVLNTQPQKIDAIADWIIKHIPCLETKKNWPQNGLKLVSLFLAAIKSAADNESNSCTTFHRTYFARIHKRLNSTENSLGQLSELEKYLETLEYLNTNFMCRIPFDCFEDSKTEFLFAVLDSVQLELLSRTIKEFAKRFALEQNLTLDDCLYQYVKKCTKLLLWNCEKSPLEERALIATENCSFPSVWLKAALLVASNASVPWSTGVQDIINTALQTDDPCKKNFECLKKTVGYKEILIKYGMTNYPVKYNPESISDIVDHIFSQDRDCALDDAVKVLSSFTDQCVRFEAHFRFLWFCLNQEGLEQFHRIYQILPPDIVIECTEKLLRLVTSLVDDEFLVKHDHESTENKLRIGVFFISKLKKLNKEFENNFGNHFQNLIKLQNSFGIYLTLSEISSKSRCQSLLEEKIDEFLTDDTASNLHPDRTEKKCFDQQNIMKIYRLGRILSFDTEETMGCLITYCLRKHDHESVVDFCREIISQKTLTPASTLMEVAKNLLENFQFVNNRSFHTMVDTIHYLTSHATSYCAEGKISDCSDVVRLSKYLNSVKDTVEHENFLNTLTSPLDDGFKNMFTSFYVDVGFLIDCEKLMSFITPLIQQVLSKKPADTDAFNKSSQELVRHMKERGQEIAALRTLRLHSDFEMKNIKNSELDSELQKVDMNQPVCAWQPDSCGSSTPDPQHQPFTNRHCSSSSSSSFEWLNLEWEDTVGSTVTNVLSHRKVDLLYAFHLLNETSKDNRNRIFETFRNNCTNLHQLTLVGKLGLELGKLNKRDDVFAYFEAVYKKAMLLSRKNVKSFQIDIVCKHGDGETDWSILRDLMASGKMDLETATECCNVFGLDRDSVLIAFFLHLIQEAEKIYHTGTVKHVDVALVQISAVAGGIQDTKLLYNTLLRLKDKVSPYSYEILLFIEEQLTALSANIQTIDCPINEDALKLLNFLKLYERTSCVTEAEITRWQVHHPSDRNLPSIASSRLPFHFFLEGNFHHIINPELTDVTLPVWKSMVSLIKMAPDDLVIITVKNLVLKYLSNCSPEDIILAEDDQFLKRITGLIETIQDDNAAVLCASWVAKKMPSGGNKVVFSDVASKIALIVCNKHNSADVSLPTRLSVMHKSSAIECVLHKNNLALDSLLAFRHSPLQLIEHLLEGAYSRDQSSESYTAVLEIGKECSIDVDEIFLKFVFKWLNLHENSNAPLDETFLNDSLLIQECKDEIHNENSMRITHLVTNLPWPSFSKLRENIAKNRIPFTQRNNLLQCLVSAFGLTAAAEIVQSDPRKLETSLIPMLCSTELKGLGLSISVDRFENCNKRELLLKLLSTYYNPKALVFCIKLCLEFDIWDSIIWKAILQRLSTKSSEYPLQDILERTQHRLKHLWASEAFITCWKHVIRNISNSSSTSNSDKVKILYKAILRCPCLESLCTQSLLEDLQPVINIQPEDFSFNAANLIKCLQNSMDQENKVIL